MSDDTTPEPFAKLFDTAHGQLLVTTESGTESEEGPCLKIRLASVFGVEPSITHGPWSDDTEGWDTVAGLLADFDQSQADDWAERFIKMLAGWAKEPTP